MTGSVKRNVSFFVFTLALCLLCEVSSVWAEERMIYDAESAYTGIQVYDKDDGLRYLRFGVYEQTAMLLSDPTYLHYAYARSIVAGFVFAEPPVNNVLLLGLGGGSLPHVITAKFPEASLDIFEIDPLVVDVAKEFFKFEPGKHGRVMVGDGRRLLHRCAKKYDLIILDAFRAGSIPFHLTTREFMQEVKDHLAPGGVVVAHLWGENVNKYFSAQVKTIADVFGRLYKFNDGEGTYKIFATKNEHWLNKQTLYNRGKALDAAKGLSFKLAEIVDEQYTQNTRVPAVDLLPGQILTDDFAPVNLLRHQSER